MGYLMNKVGVTNFLIRAGDAKTSKYSDQGYKDCIMGSINTVGNAQPSTSESTDVLRQLTEGISRQNERIEETNKLTRKEFDRKKEKDNSICKTDIWETEFSEEYRQLLISQIC